MFLDILFFKIVKEQRGHFFSACPTSTLFCTPRTRQGMLLCTATAISLKRLDPINIYCNKTHTAMQVFFIFTCFSTLSRFIHRLLPHPEKRVPAKIFSASAPDTGSAGMLCPFLRTSFLLSSPDRVRHRLYGYRHSRIARDFSPVVTMTMLLLRHRQPDAKSHLTGGRVFPQDFSFNSLFQIAP